MVTGLASLLVVLSASVSNGQELLDRVVARVDGYAITLSDLRIGIALGIVNVPAGAGEDAAVAQLVERQLMRAEVARFSPPDPDPAEVRQEVAAMRERAGGRLDAVTQATGLDNAQIDGLARDSLRIRAYLDQRFGTAAQLTEEDVLQYYRIHPEEFTRGGRQLPLADVQGEARERAAAERRSIAVTRWVQDLRRRADVAIVTAGG